MSMIVTLLLVLATAPEKGTICFDKDCAATAGVVFEVKPASTERRFVWTSADGARVVLGTLAANATSVDLTSKDARTLSLSLRGDAQRGWPLETRFAIAQGREAAWRWSTPAAAAAKPMTVRLPRGMYSLLVGAEHHRSERRPLKVDEDVSLREITLAPLPVVFGRVVTKSKSGDESAPKVVALSGAQLAGSDGKVLTATNEQGAFRAELPEPFTKEIVIAAAGYGTRVVPLRLFNAEVDLGTIELGRGVKLTAHIHRPDSLEAKTLSAQLTGKSRTQYENTVMANRELKPGENDLVFNDLSEGEYYLTLSGAGTLERLTAVIEVKADDVSKDIRIAPFQLAGSVHLGSDPLREGAVEIIDGHHTWRARAGIDAEGHFGGTMWQNESLSGWVSSKAINALPIDEAPKLSGDPAVWDIHFRNRLITGRIVDEETKQPIAGAGLDLQLEATMPAPQGGGSATNRLYSAVHVEADGSYSIAAVHNGTYDLKAHAPDHVPAAKTIELGDSDESKNVDFAMSAGFEQVVEFVWPNGQAVGGSQVVEGTARDGYNPERMYATDAAGRLKLRVVRGERHTLVILPRDGSFAIAEVAAPDKADAPRVQVVVPLPAASLRVKVDWKGKQPRFGGLAMRYNGRDLPASAVVRLPTEPVEGGGMRYRNLPAGAYELSLAGGVTARVSLTAGEESVEVAAP